MGAFLIYKQRHDKNTGNLKGIELRELDKKEAEANRYVKLYNLQRTFDEKNGCEFRYLYIDVI